MIIEVSLNEKIVGDFRFYGKGSRLYCENVGNKCGGIYDQLICLDYHGFIINSITLNSTGAATIWPIDIINQLFSLYKHYMIVVYTNNLDHTLELTYLASHRGGSLRKRVKFLNKIYS